MHGGNQVLGVRILRFCSGPRFYSPAPLNVVWLEDPRICIDTALETTELVVSVL